MTPTTYRVFDIDAAYNHEFNRFSVAGAVDIAHLDYDNVELITGVERNNQDRNRWKYSPSVRVAYEIQPGYETFLQVRYTKVNYDQVKDNNGLERSSQGGEVLGLAFDATGLITDDIALGCKYRTYDDANLGTIQSPTGWLSLVWDVTPLTTIHSEMRQDIGETTQIDVSGANITEVSLGVEHELLRSLLLKLDGGYSFLKYKGFNSAIFDAERTEHRYFVSFGGKYIFSRYLYMDLSYLFSARNSNRALNDFDQNRVFLNFVARM